MVLIPRSIAVLCGQACHIRIVLGVAGLLTVLFPAAPCRGDSATWSSPSIDSWLYTNAGSAGTRILAPSFTDLSVDQGTGEFFTLSQLSPARLGSMLLAFETSGQVPVGLDESRYVIHSVTVTTRILSGTGGSLHYTTQPATPDGLLADALESGITSELPMELYGVGFRDDYEGFALGPNPSGKRFAESTHPYSATDGGYIAYPAVADAQGGLIDVSNNLTGGYSATDGASETGTFDATPWAMGVVPGLSQGDVIPVDTTFEFELNLAEPGVLGYLQQSLSEGALGFVISSAHPTVQPGQSGGVSYPQWYTKEWVEQFGGTAEAASLAIEYEVLSEFPTGDYDQSGEVDSGDYALWRSQYGTAGPDADGNQDGVVDAIDYAVWRTALTTMPQGVANVVPEPDSLPIVGIFGATVLFCWSSHKLIAPRNREING